MTSDNAPHRKTSRAYKLWATAMDLSKRVDTLQKASAAALVRYDLARKEQVLTEFLATDAWNRYKTFMGRRSNRRS